MVGDVVDIINQWVCYGFFTVQYSSQKLYVAPRGIRSVSDSYSPVMTVVPDIHSKRGAHLRFSILSPFS